MTADAPVMRLRRPRWKDPRLIVGVILVIASVLMGALLVSRLSQTVPVLVARTDIVPGEDAGRLGADDRRAPSRGTSAICTWASSQRSPPMEPSPRSPSGQGELLPPASAIGQPVDVPLRPVVIPVGSAVAESVSVGASVELWRTPDPDETDSGASLLVEDAVVRRIDEGSALVCSPVLSRCSCPGTVWLPSSRSSRVTRGWMSSASPPGPSELSDDRRRPVRLGRR